MDATNTDLLSKLRSAANREASLLTGLSGEIVAATTHLSRLYAQEREAERRLSAWPGDPRRNSMSPDERNALDNAKVDRRRHQRHIEKIAGRPLVNEQSLLRDHVAAVARAGGNVDAALEQFARAASAGP